MPRGEPARPTDEQLAQLAQDISAALNRRDPDALLRLVHPEFEFRSLLAGVEGRAYRGGDGIRRYLRDIDDGFAEVSWELVELLVEEPSRPVIIFRMRAQGRGSDVPFDLETAQVWSFRDGQLVRSDVFRSTEEALDAAPDT